MNKETVEQAAKEYVGEIEDIVDMAGYNGFIKGVKWHEKQSNTDAIEFAEWIKENQFYEAKGMWMRKNALTAENEGRYNWTSLTSKQLYELYKQSIL